jgi:four helix bundle protein
MSSHRDLIVWQKSYQLSIIVYSLTQKFPKEEMFGLVSQLRRASVLIPSNIAEGNTRFSKKDNAQFMRIAYGSACEVDTQLLLSKDLKYISEKEYTEAVLLLSEIMKMLYTLLIRASNV